MKQKGRISVLLHFKNKVLQYLLEWKRKLERMEIISLSSLLMFVIKL